MRSPGSTRLLVERVLRGASLLALLALAVRLWSGTAASGASRSTTGGLDSALVRWSMDPPGEAVVDADTLPVRAQRDWLVALRRTGTNLRWTSRDSSGGALVVQAPPQPGAPARVAALTAPGRSVSLADALGFVDSASASERGVVVWAASPIGIVTAHVGNAIASAAPRDSFSAKPVLVVGQAGWESRFVVTALEESGWSVAARMQVAPGAVVRQQAPARIDTANVSALVVLDSTSALDGGEVATFVRQGGGLVASGPGTRHASIRALLPQVRDGTPGEIGGLLGPTPRTGLSARTLVANAASVPLERRGNDPVVVGRRVGSGRVLAVGYDETWRLRMVPPADSAPDVHRNWWSSMVGGVALVRPVAREVGMADEAPYASTVAALGRPLSSTGDAPRRRWPWEMLLALIAGFASLGEWTSRRLRGLA